MTEETEGPSSQDRFEVLKTLLKEQIKANEILKYELLQLNKLYQKVCAEKNVLLNELLDHHSACSNAVGGSGPQPGVESSLKEELIPNTYKRSSSAVRSYPNEFNCNNDIKTTNKRPKFDSNSVKLSPRKDSPPCVGVSEQTVSHEQDPWHQQEDMDDIMSSIPHPKSATSISPCTSSNSRNPNSRLQTLATQLNSSAGLSEPSRTSSWQRQLNNSCSPPTLTVSTSVNQAQRSGKATSLVTSSTLTSTGGPISVVQRVGPSTKYLSPTNRGTVGLLSTSTLPKANLVINASTTSALNASNQKPAFSQGAPTYRLSCSSTGQRILIQPSEHARQIRIQQVDGRIGGLTEDAH